MKRNQAGIKAIMAAIGFMILIMDSKSALEGARTGLDLCTKTVIPALFPFFILSTVLTNSLTALPCWPIEQIACKLGMSKEASSVLVPAILGGYPVGAKCIRDLFQTTQITRSEAERLLSFCSNAGPSFLFGMVSSYFPQKKTIWALWFIQISCAVLTAFIIPARTYKNGADAKANINTSQNVVFSSMKAMALVCCWVILFRMVQTFLSRWLLWLLPGWVKVLITGLLELTNGCTSLNSIENVSLRFIVCSCMLSFGGLCVLLQTASVIGDLSVGSYLKGKLIQSAFSFLLSSAIASDKGLYYFMCIPVVFILLKKVQKSSSNPRILPV